MIYLHHEIKTCQNKLFVLPMTCLAGRDAAVATLDKDGTICRV